MVTSVHSICFDIVQRTLLCGDGVIEAELPDDLRILTAPPSLPALDDPWQSVREALRSPVDHLPLSELVGPASKVTIAIDDLTIPVVPMEPDFRRVALEVLLEQLHAAGVSPENVKIVVANALHRQWTRSELSTALGPLLSLLPPQRLFNHDACDPDQLVFLGETDRGFEVELNKLVLDSDQLIYVNCTPSPMNGGWKSVMVGLSTFRSIRHHHRPFPFAHGHSIMDPQKSAFHRLLAEMGKVLESHLEPKGRRLFSLEFVPTGTVPAGIAGVHAGYPPSVHQHTLAQLAQQQRLEVDGQADIGIWGLPNRDPYSALSTINPILVANLACSYTFGLFSNKPLIREGGVAIFANPMQVQWARHHASYPELWDELDRTIDPIELWDELAEDFAARPEYVYAYRRRFSFHGAHPLFLWGQSRAPRKHLGRIIFCGGDDPAPVERMGFTWARTVEDALAIAESDVGANASTSLVELPPVFIPHVA